MEVATLNSSSTIFSLPSPTSSQFSHARVAHRTAPFARAARFWPNASRQPRTPASIARPLPREREDQHHSKTSLMPQ